MDKIKIAVLFGGCSEEHDISVKSAGEIAASINKEKYEPVYIGITKSGEWKICEKPCADWENGGCPPAVLSPDRKARGFITENGVINVDVIFPVIHGKTGEDGAIQGLLELSGIPYVGCDIQSSALCMDKSLAYIAVRNAGIKTPDFEVVSEDEALPAAKLTYPVFIKPARSGSSFGVTKVNSADELKTAIKTAGQYDNKILIEQSVSGCEVGCAVLGNGSDLITGEADQIRLSHGIFRIHQEAEPEKGSENSTITVPADLPAEASEQIKQTAKKIYKALGCKGLARVDMFLQDDGEIILNEVNTMPGFTSYSRYPRMMNAAGITIPDLIDRLISLALKE